MRKRRTFASQKSDNYFTQNSDMSLKMSAQNNIKVKQVREQLRSNSKVKMKWQPEAICLVLRTLTYSRI